MTSGNLKISGIVPFTGKQMDATERKLAAVLKKNEVPSYEVYTTPLVASAGKYWAIYRVRYDNAPEKAIKELKEFCLKNKLSV